MGRQRQWGSMICLLIVKIKFTNVEISGPFLLMAFCRKYEFSKLKTEMVQPLLDTKVIGLWVQLSFLGRAMLLLLVLASPSTTMQSIKTNLCISGLLCSHPLCPCLWCPWSRPVMQPVTWLHPSWLFRGFKCYYIPTQSESILFSVWRAWMSW